MNDKEEWWIRDGSNFDASKQVMGMETAPFRRATPEEIQQERMTQAYEQR